MNITAADVNKLRQVTSAGMMDCKKALVESNGDFDAAIDLLRKQGLKVAAKRADNSTSEGVILTHIAPDGKKGVLVALACETEPVSNVADFKQLASDIMAVAIANNISSKDELLSSTLTNGAVVSQAIIDLIGKIGEKIEIAAFENLTADHVVSYIHSNGKLGVLVGLVGVAGAEVSEMGKDIAMQIAAMKPIAVNRNEVDTTVLEKELEIAREQARAEGKPEQMLDKIAQGRLEKFFKEQTLLAQQFVKDNSITIAQLLEQTQKGMTVNAFKRIQLGA